MITECVDWLLKMSQRPTAACLLDYQDHADKDLPWVLQQIAENPEVYRKLHDTKVKDLFPFNLHDMVESSSMSSQSDIIRWSPHGRAFRVYDKDRLVNELLPRYLKRQTKFASFQRQLNMYGFLKLLGDHSDKGGYYHPLFLRGRPALSKLIFRNEESESKVRRKWDPTTEPDFLQMPPVSDIVSGPAVGSSALTPPSSIDYATSSTLSRPPSFWSHAGNSHQSAQPSHHGDYYQSHHAESAPANLGATGWPAPSSKVERVAYSAASHGHVSYPAQPTRFQMTPPAFLDPNQQRSSLSIHDQSVSPLKLDTGTATSVSAALSPTALAPAASLVPRCLPPPLEAQLAQSTESRLSDSTAPALALLQYINAHDGRGTNRPSSKPDPPAARDVSLDVNNSLNAPNVIQCKRKKDDSWWPDIADHSLHDDGDLALDCGSAFSDDDETLA
jgi:HSF-type DNA-binding